MIQNASWKSPGTGSNRAFYRIPENPERPKLERLIKPATEAKSNSWDRADRGGPS
jgi:hypothetical protein